MHNLNQIPTLADWLAERLPILHDLSFKPSPIRNVTVLAYFFWSNERIYSEFWKIETAFLQTFHICGLLPGILVVNQKTAEMESFCRKYGIEIQIEESLDRGGLPAMSIDCIAKLHSRFKTEYVLIIQNDGMPMRDGLGDFLGKFDYVGAPWPGHTTYYDLFPYPKFGVGNGGFSLRSKGICQTVSRLYSRYASRIPYNWLFVEDVFYCKTLRLMAPSAYRDLKFPIIEEAAKFSIECEIPSLPNPPIPFGFHAEKGFRNYQAIFAKHGQTLCGQLGSTTTIRQNQQP